MGGNGFAQFDSASITTTTSTEKTFSIGKTTFRRRDLLLAGIAILALIGVIILAIVLAVEMGSDSDSNKPSIDSYCHSSTCLKSAQVASENMNRTADPCDDFYAYACGGYAANHPRSPDMEYVNPENIIYSSNMGRLQAGLLEAIQDDDPKYLKDMKTFFATCNAHFDKMELRGTPFLQHIVAKMEGWWLFGEFDPSKFDLQNSLHQVHFDFWTEAFFSIFGISHELDWDRNIMQVNPGGYRLPRAWYSQDGDIPEIHQIRLDYIKYIIDIGHLIRLDKRLDFDPVLVTNFSLDVYEIERTLALYTSYGLNFSRINYRDEIHKDENTVTLDQVTRDLNNTIDFTKLVQYMTREETGRVTGQTKIAVYHKDYFYHLGVVLGVYLATDEGKRKLHNYMAWKLLDRFARELSWEYIHQARQFSRDLYGYKNQEDLYFTCLMDLSDAMSTGLRAMFAKHYADQKRRSQARTVVDEIKEELKKTTNDFTWMTEDEKKIAHEKILQTIFKVGYVDEMKDDSVMNAMYSGVTIQEDDHFGNVLSLYQHKRRTMSEAIFKTTTQTAAEPLSWGVNIWDPSVKYYDEWHTFELTYGAIESPLFLLNGPAFYNFGGLGSAAGEKLFHAMDRFGRYFSPGSPNLQEWWGEQTVNNYYQLLECAVNTSLHVPFHGYVDSNGNPYSEQEDLLRYVLSDQADSIVAGASGARLAYRVFMERHQREPLPYIPPGQDPAKMFFLGYAQFFCENVPDSTLYMLETGRMYNLPKRERVNLVMAQLPEFRQAFQCPATAKLARGQPCLLFP